MEGGKVDGSEMALDEYIKKVKRKGGLKGSRNSVRGGRRNRNLPQARTSGRGKQRNKNMVRLGRTFKAQYRRNKQKSLSYVKRNWKKGKWTGISPMMDQVKFLSRPNPIRRFRQRAGGIKSRSLQVALASKRLQQARRTLTSRRQQRPQKELRIGPHIKLVSSGFVTVRNRNRQRERQEIQRKISRVYREMTPLPSREPRASTSALRRFETPFMNSIRRSPRTARSSPRSRKSLADVELESMRFGVTQRPREIQPSIFSPMYSDFIGSSAGIELYQPNRMKMSMPRSFENTPRATLSVSRPDQLDPDIQRKIQFIQSRARASGDYERHHIIPDFMAPVASSGIKLSDRFRLLTK